MIRSRQIRPALVTAVAATVCVALLPAAPAAANSDRPTVRVIADGLLNPRGITVDDGVVYVAEAGAGGSTAVEIPEELGGPFTLCFGESGAITQIRNRTQRRVVEGLASYTEPGPGESCDPAVIGEAVLGPSDVAVARGKRLVITVGLFAPPAGRDFVARTAPFAAELGTLKSVRPNGRERTLADLAAYEARRNPDRGELESNPNSVALLRGNASLVVDASGNDLLRVGANGNVRTVAVFPNRELTVPQLSCPAPPDFPPAGTPIDAQAVPTAVTLGPDGAYYVGQLTGFPFTPGAAKVFRIDPRTGAVSDYAAGFSAIVDIAFGPDGSLYVLEMARYGLLEAFGCNRTEGRLVRIKHGVKRELRVPGLVLPGGVDVARNGTVYVTNHSVERGGAGQVLKISTDD